MMATHITQNVLKHIENTILYKQMHSSKNYYFVFGRAAQLFVISLRRCRCFPFVDLSISMA